MYQDYQPISVNFFQDESDSGPCRLSDNDNITVLAGQNESGKSSILQALRDFKDEELDIDCLREDDTLPEISITYSIEDGEIDIDSFFEGNDYPEACKDLLSKINEFTVLRTFSSANKCTTTVTVSEELTEKLKQLINQENEKINRPLRKIILRINSGCT